MSLSEVSIAPECEATILITWTPKEAGSWRDTLQFTDSRIKYDVALTTTCTDTHKGPLKGKKRVLTTSNGSNFPNVTKLNHAGIKMNMPPKIQHENKENNENFRKSQKNSTPMESRQHNNMKSSLDISSFQLTPLQSTSRQQHSTLPAINIFDASPVVSDISFAQAIPLIAVTDATEINFTNHEISIISPEFSSAPPLRRQTYKINTNIHLNTTQSQINEEDEDFDDSLSPKGTMDFSALINNMAFTTPMKFTSPTACSTGNASESSEGSFKSLSNNTFNISGNNSVSKHNNTYELPASPTTSNTSGNLTRRRLTNSFERIFPTETTTPMTIINPCVSSSPILCEQTRLRVPQSSFRHGDRGSVKDVLEADLWVKDNDFFISSASLRNKSTSLTTIAEENLYTATSIPFKDTDKSLVLPKNYTVSISPPLKQLRRSPAKNQTKVVKKIEKPQITKDNSVKKKPQLRTPMKCRNKTVASAVKITKLSLAGLHNTTKSLKKPTEVSVKLQNSNDYFPIIDPFAAGMTVDPFLTHILTYDEQWIVQQERGFTKWLNALLTPPEQLNADIETTGVDVGKVWQASRMKENVALAETREAVSARYHTNTRLNTLRKAAISMFNRAEVKTPIARALATIEKGNLVIRPDRDLHRDIGLQKEILELFLSYNPLWLRIGLEVIYGETIPLQSNNDLVGLTKFLLTRFFSDPYLVQQYSLGNVTSLKHPAFTDHLNKFILRKFLLIVYFLDYAKQQKLIGHDPCLFHKKASYKDSRAILLTFSRQVLMGVGDLTKILRSHGYVVSHKQTYLDEYNYAVEDISMDLRDGVRLCRVMELITGDKTLTCRCRVPAISRLQKVHNNELAVTALIKAGYKIAGEIDAKCVADGHREKTLSLLWQIIYKFQAPRFEKASSTLQKWWRAMLWYIRVKNYLSQRKNNAAIIIQRTWRCHKARELNKILRAKQIEENKKINNAAKIIQMRWIATRIMLHYRREFLLKKIAVICIQKWFRRIRTSRPYLQELARKRQATLLLQRQWRAKHLMKKQQCRYNKIKIATIKIQKWWRYIFICQTTQKYYQQLKFSVIIVQNKWRAQLLMRNTRKLYLQQLGAIRKIQCWWRCVKIYREYRVKRNSAIVIQKWWRSCVITRTEKSKFLSLKKAVILAQTMWRMKQARENYQKIKQSAINIENWYVNSKIARHVRCDYINKKNAAILIQKWWRALKYFKQCQSNYLIYRQAAVIIQRHWRARSLANRQRINYLNLQKATLKIQNWWRMIITRRAYLINLKRNKAAIILQSRWRAKQACERCRKEFIHKKSTVLLIQRRYRANKLAATVHNNYLSLQKACIIVQKNWRMLKICREYKKIKEAATVLQIRWRARSLALNTQLYYLKMQSSAIVIQEKYRARKIGRIQRNYYLKIQKSVLIIQKNWRIFSACRDYKMRTEAARVLQIHWRARQLSINTRNDFLALKTATIKIQHFYRCRLITIACRQNYLNDRRLIVLIQTIWRAKRSMQAARRDYLKIRMTVLQLQCTWRMLIVRKKFLIMKNATLILQRAWRNRVIAKNTRNEFLKLKNSAIYVQRRWKCQYTTKKIRQEFIKLRRTIIFVQNKWQYKQQLRLKNARLSEQMILIDAATLIQATWRGHKVRTLLSKEINDLRERSKAAAAAATPSTTIEYRLHEAINLLKNFVNIGQLLMCLACIDTLTRLSPNGCILFCELNLVEQIYQILEKSNRSLPWLEVCLRCVNILITLVKLPQTKNYVRQIDGTETIARLMSVTVKTDVNLFLHSATLMWLLLDDENFLIQVQNEERTVWLLKTSFNAAMKKDIGITPVKAKNKNQSLLPNVLPNPKPDWGLKTRRPRCFTSVNFAITTLIEQLNILPMS